MNKANGLMDMGNSFWLSEGNGTREADNGKW